MQPPEVLQALFLLVLGPLQEARLQVHRPSPEFREPALPEDLVKLSAEPELDQILDDRMGGGLQNRLRGFAGDDSGALRPFDHPVSDQADPKSTRLNSSHV